MQTHKNKGRYLYPRLLFWQNKADENILFMDFLIDLKAINRPNISNSSNF